MKKGDIIWALIDAMDDLTYLRAKLDVLQSIVYKMEIREEEARISLGRGLTADERPGIQPEEIRDIFDWPMCERVHLLRKEEQKRLAEEAAKAEEKKTAPTACQPEEPVYVWEPEDEPKEEPAEDPEEDPGEDQEEDAEGGPDKEEEEDPYGIKEAARKILAAGSELSAEDKRRARNRKIVELYQGGMTGKEIAKETGCSAGTVALVLKKWKEQS